MRTHPLRHSLGLGLLLLALTALPAAGQSLLSIPPEGWEPPPAGEDGGTAPGDELPDSGDAQGAAASAWPTRSGETAGAGQASAEEGSGGGEGGWFSFGTSAAPPKPRPVEIAPGGGVQHKPRKPLGDWDVSEQPAAPAPPAAVGAEPELAELLRLVDLGRGREAYEALEAHLAGALERARRRGDDPDVLEKEILIHLLRAGDGLAPPEQQEANARRFIEKYPDDDRFPLAFFYLIRALFNQSKALETSFFFDDDARATLPEWMQTSLLTMQAKAAARQGEFLQAAELLLAERQGAFTLQSTRPDEVEAMLEQVGDVDALMAFVERHEDLGWLEEKKPFLRARALINQGEIGAALLAINGILQEGLATSPEQIKAIHAARAEVEARLLIVPERIGVLLPLSSSSRALRELARETLDGLRMGLRYGQPPAGKGPVQPGLAADPWVPSESRNGAHKPAPRDFELVLRDTGNDPQRAAAAVEQLAREEHVIAIIGPIARSESSAAAQAAEVAGVPLVSFSLTMDVPPESRYVFRHSKSQEEEVRDLVRYAMDYAGARRFLLLYPDTGYGRRITDLFWTSVREKGGRVVGAEAYSDLAGSPIQRTGEVGLKQIFERFTGLDRPQSPEDLALQEAVGDSHADPVVDFDAIFVPIGPTGSQDLQLIAPYPVTVDAEKVLLLGNRFWNTDEVIVASDGKLDGAVFVDAFDRMSMRAGLRNFRRRHRIMFGHRADFRAASYYTAFAYDTLNILMRGIRDRGHRTRVALARWLVNMEPYSGVTGLTTFLDSGEAVKESMFFTIDGDRISRLLP